MKALVMVLFVVPSLIFSQTGSIEGAIYEGNQPIQFANVGLVGTSYGSPTDSEGKFVIQNIPVGKYTIQVSSVGFKTYKESITIVAGQTILFDRNIESTAEQMDAFVVTGTLKETSMMESAVPIEVYKPVYFKKNPTPSLFQSLQIVNGVRPQINCSVCGTGDVHINGMEGPYTMVTIDGMPVVGGLASVYGLNGIPNSMIAQMEVVKGPASTLYGSEAVGGLINVITASPESAPHFSVDVMGTNWSEVNTDVSTKYKIGKKVNALIGISYFNNSNPIDKNGDNFTDITLVDRVSVFNKYSFKRQKDRVSTLGFRYVYEDMWGGEMQWTPEHRGKTTIYGESVYTNRYEILGKYQLPVNEDVYLSFSYADHHQNAMYGTTPYIGDQDIAYGQLHWNKRLWELHDFTLGTAFRYTYYDDNTPATFSADTLNPYNNPDHIYLPGVFIQDAITLHEKHKLLLGGRIDYDTRHGRILTPRANYKWMPNDNNIIRLSLGTGYRVVNIFTEDHAATIGVRDVVIAEDLNPEKSINANLHYQKFINTDFGFINFDASVFATHFSNKITPDYETDDDKIIYENIDGYAVSRGASFNTTWNFSLPLKIKLGGTFLDVYEMNNNENGEMIKEKQLLTESVSGTFSVSYTFYKPNIKIDYSGNVCGPMKLPLLENDFRPAYSSWYSIQNIQITKTIKGGWEVYGGVKNLLNFTPPSYSILRAHDPFDEKVDDPVDNPRGLAFDPTYVYTSFQGIRGFIGIRYNLVR